MITETLKNARDELMRSWHLSQGGAFGASFALGEVIQAVYGNSAPIRTEQVLINYVLNFANRAELRHLPLAKADDAEIEAQREWLRDRLAALQDPEPTLDINPAWAQESVSGIWPLPIVSQAPVSLINVWILTDVAGLALYVLMLLLKDPYRGNLYRCQLQGCDRFFLAKKKAKRGLPRTKYCSEAHAKKAHEAGNLKRVRDHRQKLREARSKKTRRRG